MKIPFNKPYMTGKELWYISQAHHRGMLAGDGHFTKECHAWLEQHTGARKALLTHSCTAALEMAAILADLQAGDEVIMPSYTFVSTANAVVLRGAVPVFIDIRRDTLNMDERLVEQAITPRTKAIIPVHYAGVGCDMDAIMEVANRHCLLVIEDAAQGLMGAHKDRPLGSIGHLGCLSFHETKNIISGEGGALLVNDASFEERAEIIREKGTNRSQFFRGMVDKYTWVDLGSSYLPGELIAAFLFAQMEEAKAITQQRTKTWTRYHSFFESLEAAGHLRRPVIPADCTHNAHMYYLLVSNLDQRTRLLEWLRARGVLSVFHYVPLHASPAGQRFARTSGSMAVTEELAERLVRLPLMVELSRGDADKICSDVADFFANEPVSPAR